jgi:hypothetical protein
MMIFIPMDELYSSSYDFHHKLQFNHENFIGEETILYWGIQKPQYFDQTQKREEHHPTSPTRKPTRFSWHVPPSALPAGRAKSRGNGNDRHFQAQDKDLVMACQA